MPGAQLVMSRQRLQVGFIEAQPGTRPNGIHSRGYGAMLRRSDTGPDFAVIRDGFGQIPASSRAFISGAGCARPCQTGVYTARCMI